MKQQWICGFIYDGVPNMVIVEGTTDEMDELVDRISGWDAESIEGITYVELSKYTPNDLVNELIDTFNIEE